MVGVVFRVRVIFALSVHEMGRNLSQNMFRINFLKRNIRKKKQETYVYVYDHGQQFPHCKVWLSGIMSVYFIVSLGSIPISEPLTFLSGDPLFEPSNREDSTYEYLCYASLGKLVGMRNSSMGLPRGVNLTTTTT